METEGKLPKFRCPPLIEVVHGVQFQPLPMTIAHPGIFYSRIRDHYPLVQTVAPLAPVREIFDVAAPMRLQLDLLLPSELPRAWFFSQDDALLVQLQQDRLLLNWRRRTGEAEYPHFETVAAEFRRIYEVLEAFVAEHELGSLEPNQCEMTYINHLHPPIAAAERLDPAGLLRLWAGETGPEWDVPLDDVTFTARYLLRGEDSRPAGRLTANLTTLISPARGERMLQLELTARGAPSSAGLPGVMAFHKMAHEHIVRCFAGITTPAAHEKWERWQ